MTKVIAIIVAAGKSIRMNATVRKQYQPVAGFPIVVHTLKAFDSCQMIDEICLVIPEEDLEFCRNQIVSPANLKKNIYLVAGGPKRQDSVYNGLKAIGTDSCLVVIHDGVRPFITHDQLEACINGAKKHGACILGIPAYDTLKHVSSTGTIVDTLERDTIWLAQTPQAFRYDLITKAHEVAREQNFTATDDAALVEQMGLEVKILTGSRENIKITNQQDLKLARILFESQ